MLPCGHRFHPSCVDEWLKKQGKNVAIGFAVSCKIHFLDQYQRISFAGGTCPTCRHDPLQSPVVVSRPLAVEPEIDVVSTLATDDERPSLEPVRPWESDSDERLSTEREDTRVGGVPESAQLSEPEHSDSVVQTRDSGQLAEQATSRGRNSSSATADENSVLVWSP